MIQLFIKSIFYHPNKEIIYNEFYEFLNHHGLFLDNQYQKEKKYFLIPKKPHQTNNLKDIENFFHCSFFCIGHLDIYFQFLSLAFKKYPKEMIITIVHSLTIKQINYHEFISILKMIPLKHQKQFLHHSKIKFIYKDYIDTYQKTKQ